MTQKILGLRPTARKLEVDIMEKNKMTNAKALSYIMDNCDLPQEIREKVENMIASLNRKSVKKLSANNEERVLFVEVLDILKAHDKMTVSEIFRAMNSEAVESTQKVTGLLGKLSEMGCVARVEEKSRPFYKFANDLPDVPKE